MPICAASRSITFFRERSDRTALVVWGLLAAIISISVFLQPDRHTVTPVYRYAAQAWQSGAKLYHVTDGHGYQYLPIAAILYRPITALPPVVGDLVWRWLCIGLLFSALWRLARLLGGDRASPHFFLITILCLPATFSSARNGQFNLPLAALLLNAALDLGTQRWNRAAAGLSLAFALKTFAFPMLLLAAALYRPMRLRAVLGTSVVLGAPFLCGTAAYVTRQYELYWVKMHALANPNEHFCNLDGLLQSVGIELPAGFHLIAAGIAGLLVLEFGWRAQKSAASPLDAAFATYALFVSYLMLSNPKTETNSYVILAPALAAFAVARGHADGWSWRSRLLALLTLGLGSENCGQLLFRATNFWLKPAIALGFVACLLAAFRQGRGIFAGAGATTLSPPNHEDENPPTTTKP